MDDTTTTSDAAQGDDAAAAPGGPSGGLDPLTSDPRELMQALLPVARRDYVKAWELLADASTPLDRRRLARDRAKAIAEAHSLIAGALRGREASLSGNDLHNARHLADELERHAAALGRLAEVSPVGLQTSKDLRPEALGCGKRYRDPAKAPKDAPSKDGRGKRGGGAGAGDKRGGAGRSGGDARRGKRPFEDRGPKVDRSKLGTNKHDSQLGDDLDEATRAKLEALRSQLED
ncbi:MAG: hypothetical protein KDC46_05995 [Thermoleophilia bacterium]|nr:hypothetical protein [Thermoleophilia bacterium]